MPVITDTEAAYLAGFIDADGHIGIVRRTTRRGDKHYAYIRPVVQIGQAKRKILDWISDLVGGTVSIHGQRGFYNLRFHAGTIRWLLPQLLPYMQVKKRQAQIVLEFTDLSRVTKNGKSLSENELARREGLRAECSALNVKPLTERRRLEEQQSGLRAVA